MRVVRPNPLMEAAATILGPVRQKVVVVGALAVQIALDGYDVSLAPTRDIDAGLDATDATGVVDHLQGQGMRPSTLAHERGFTWVKGDVKVQLMAPFNPIERRKPAARGLPVNNVVGELADHRWLVAFERDPDRGLLYSARPLALVGLKQAAFGRTRPNGEKVDRDYSDVALLLDRLQDEIVAEAEASPQMRARVIRAARALVADESVAAAARELVASGQEESQRLAEAMVRRAAQAAIRRLGEVPPKP